MSYIKLTVWSTVLLEGESAPKKWKPAMSLIQNAQRQYLVALSTLPSSVLYIKKLFNFYVTLRLNLNKATHSVICRKKEIKVKLKQQKLEQITSFDQFVYFLLVNQYDVKPS